MTGYKFWEFKKSQYSYDAIEKALSEKESEGWKVVSVHTDCSVDPKGVIVVLLKQIIPGDDESLPYIQRVEKKEAELALKKIQKQIDDLDRAPSYDAYCGFGPLGSAVALGQTEAMRNSDVNANGFLGVDTMGSSDSKNAPALNNNDQPYIGKFCTNCGAPIGTGNFCGNCGNPI